MRTQISKYFLLLLIALHILACSNQKKPDTLENAILNVVKAFKEKDGATLNGCISKEHGLITLYRIGVFDQYERAETVDFDNPVPSYLPYFEFSTDFNIQFEALPTIDCGSMEWSKTGLFCDTTQTDHLLSNAAKNLRDFNYENISDQDIEAFTTLENNSHRVVLCDKDGGELIFYLTLIREKWYLTIIDRVTSDCSA
jgi:hypothetical protein